MAIIARIRAKGKAVLDRIPDGVLTALVLILCCSLSFGLGLMMGQDTRGGEVRIEQLAFSEGIQTAEAAPLAVPATLPQGGQYVASKTGKSYHLPWCGSAKQIKEENKIWFATKEDAEKAGYAPAKNCKGI